MNELKVVDAETLDPCWLCESCWRVTPSAWYRADENGPVCPHCPGDGDGVMLTAAVVRWGDLRWPSTGGPVLAAVNGRRTWWHFGTQIGETPAQAAKRHNTRRRRVRRLPL